jgi:probable F420-dependent oxidoreductase
VKFAISYSLPFHGADPERLAGFAQYAEQSGFEAIYVPEHVALSPGVKSGGMELPPTLPYPDPLDCLTFVAAATERILLGTGVLLLPYHHPVGLAKRLATIDHLSKGRMRLLTIGVGILPVEAQAVGVDFSTRGRRADEAIDVLRLLWESGADGASFDGEFYRFENVCSYPKPLDVVHLPIHVGGSSRASARRAGARGDGYFPGGALSDDERRSQFELARESAVRAGRDPDALEYTRWASIDLSAEAVEAYAAQGVTRLVVSSSATDPSQQRDELAAFAARFGL